MSRRSKCKVCILLLFLLPAFVSIAQVVLTIPNDPIRQIGDNIYSLQPIYDWEKLPVNDRSWRPMQEWIGVSNSRAYDIYYRIEEVVPDGLILSGPNVLGGDRESSETIFLKNYPGADKVVDGDMIGFMAIRCGSYKYTNTTGAISTIAAYDYGVPYVPPPLTPDQLKAAQAAADAHVIEDKKKSANLQSNAVRWLQSQATNGDSDAQCDLGEHYLKGEGCETNMELAVYWLKKSASQGDIEASNKLTALDP